MSMVDAMRQNVIGLWRAFDQICGEINKRLAFVAAALALLVLIQIVQLDLRTLTEVFADPSAASADTIPTATPTLP